MNSLIVKIRNKTAKICVVGLGYVGLPTAVAFAGAGYDVIGVDLDRNKIQQIAKGICPLKDLRIEEKLIKVVRGRKLKVSFDATHGCEISDIVLITLPTPITKEKEPDLQHIISAGKDIAKSLKKGQLVILESTTFPGTTEGILRPILEESGLRAEYDFGLAHCPERYNPGDPDHTLDKVARIVGGISPKWGEIAKKLYQSITTEEVLQVSNIKTAEAAKIIENIQRDLNIALMNEIALIFERMNIDIIEVIDAAATKWNFVKVYPGAGVGGHCLPVDPYYLTHKAKELGFYPKVILAGREINDFMPTHIVNLIVDGLSEVNKVVAHSKIAILGVSYKANTEDLRNSPGIEIVKILLEMGGDVCIHDPLVKDKILFKNLGLQNEKMERVLNGADCITITIAHDQFKKLKIKDIANCVNPMGVLVDAAHIFDPKKVIEKQIVYRGVGRVGND